MPLTNSSSTSHTTSSRKAFINGHTETALNWKATAKTSNKVHKCVRLSRVLGQNRFKHAGMSAAPMSKTAA